MYFFYLEHPHFFKYMHILFYSCISTSFHSSDGTEDPRNKKRTGKGERAQRRAEGKIDGHGNGFSADASG